MKARQARQKGAQAGAVPAAAALHNPRQCQSPGEPDWALWDRTRHMCEQEMAWSQHQLLLTSLCYPIPSSRNSKSDFSRVSHKLEQPRLDPWAAKFNFACTTGDF